MTKLILVEESMTCYPMRWIYLFFGSYDCRLRTISVLWILPWKAVVQFNYWTCSNVVLFCITIIAIVRVVPSKVYASFPFIRTRILEE
jgi:hypothetical protein